MNLCEWCQVRWGVVASAQIRTAMSHILVGGQTKRLQGGFRSSKHKSHVIESTDGTKQFIE